MVEVGKNITQDKNGHNGRRRQVNHSENCRTDQSRLLPAIVLTQSSKDKASEENLFGYGCHHCPAHQEPPRGREFGENGRQIDLYAQIKES